MENLSFMLSKEHWISHMVAYMETMMSWPKITRQKVVRAASHRLVSCHESNVINGRSVFTETPVSIPTDLRRYRGD